MPECQVKRKSRALIAMGYNYNRPTPATVSNPDRSSAVSLVPARTSAVLKRSPGLFIGKPCTNRTSS